MRPETALSTFPDGRIIIHGPLFIFLSSSATRNNLFIIQSVFLHRTHVCNENNRNGFIGEPTELKRHLGIDPVRRKPHFKINRVYKLFSQNINTCCGLMSIWHYTHPR